MPVPMTDDQLRPYCSDVFISQEHQRRFGDSMTPYSDHRVSTCNRQDTQLMNTHI